MPAATTIMTRKIGKNLENELLGGMALRIEAVGLGELRSWFCDSISAVFPYRLVYYTSSN